MNPWRWVDPKIRQVRLAGVTAYLEGRGWHPVPNPNPHLLRFEAPEDGSAPAAFQMVPASDSLDDFLQSITYFITTLSEIEDRHPDDILDDILAHQKGEARKPGRVSVANRSTGA
jgi:hypothetical protein